MKKNAKSKKSCDINFSKVKERSVKVFVDDKKHNGVEIVGSKGKYAIVTDSSKESLKAIRGKTGSLKEVKGYVSNHLCGMQNAAKKEMPKADPATPNEAMQGNS